LTLRLGTRGSALALIQSNHTRDKIEKASPDRAVDIVVVKTTGDKVTDKALFRIGGKGLFTKELEEKLLDGTLDMAVHSLKDLPTELPPGLRIGAVLERGSPFDALVTPGGETLSGLPEGAAVGTSSLRRRAQIRALRPDLRMTDLRGNLDTRMKKLTRGEMAAMVAARAGLDRLGIDLEGCRVEDLVDMLPAPGQGAIAVEVKADRADLSGVLRSLNHSDTDACVRAERSFLHALGGGCHVPIGALGTLSDRGLTLRGIVASVDGTRVITREGTTLDEPEALGTRLAAKVLEAGGRKILAELEDGNQTEPEARTDR
jgi:hydroxymethylbilane synthase